MTETVFDEEDFLIYSESRRLAIFTMVNVEKGDAYEVKIFENTTKLIERLLLEGYKILHSTGKFEDETLEIIFQKGLIKRR